MNNENITIKTAEQTRDPEVTQIIVDILKEISPEYADYSFNLIDCLERIVAKVLHAIVLGDTAEGSADAVMHLLAESIEQIHEAMVRDYEDGIERL